MTAGDGKSGRSGDGCGLDPLLEFLPSEDPPPGLAERVEARLGAIDKARTRAALRAARARTIWHMLGAGLAGALLGAGLVAAHFLA